MTSNGNPDPAYRPFLDQVRWVSAALVAIGHAIAILNSQANGLHAFNLIAGMRGEAVTLFFILSGYLVGGSVVRDFDRFSFSFGRYAIARLSRIYIVLIPALVLTLILDGAVLSLDPHNPVYAAVWQGGALGDASIWSRFSPIHLFGTILCLEPVIGGPVGSAGSLWSLGFEWIFYFAFPAIYGLGYRLRGSLGAGMAVLVSIGLVFIVSKIDAAFWLVWLLGAYANLVERRGWLRAKTWTPWLKGAAGAFLVFYVGSGDNLKQQIGLPLAGVAGFFFLACGDNGEKRLVTPVDAKLAHFSYSLYVIHLQMMTAFTAVLVRLGVIPLEGLANPLEVIGLSALFVGLSALVAYGFGQAFESRTQDLSRLLRARLMRPAAADLAGPT
jgi:peptidoglycan/LPS O-acetylase OafA/YrhL